MSIRQAQEVAALLGTLGVRWNGAWAGGPATALDAVELPGGMRITLLSPAARNLRVFVDMWRKQVRVSMPGVPPASDPDQPQTRTTDDPDRPVLYIANVPEDDVWRSRLMDALGPLHVQADVLFGDFSEPDAWQRSDRAPRGRPRVAVILLSDAGLTATFAHEQIDALVEAVSGQRLMLTWMLVGPCAWESTPLARFPALNDTRTPLSALADQDANRTLTTATLTLAKIVKDAAAIQQLVAPALDEAPASRSESPVPRRKRGDDRPVDVETLAGHPYNGDRSVANNASLAFLAEFEGKTLLIGGDASAETLAESILALLKRRGQERLRVDAFVVPNNGSAANLHRDLLELLDCERYLISTNGATFRHPDRETIARILTYGRVSPQRPLTLVFNYRTPQTTIWDDPALQARWNYRTVFPAQDGNIALHV